MADEPVTDTCVVCGEAVPDDPPTVTVPSPVGARLSPLAAPGVRKLAFCSQRHRRDWQAARRGEWSAPSDEEDATGATDTEDS